MWPRPVAEATAERPLDWLVYSAGIQRYGNCCGDPRLKKWDLVQSVNAARSVSWQLILLCPACNAAEPSCTSSSVQGPLLPDGRGGNTLPARGR